MYCTPTGYKSPCLGLWYMQRWTKDPLSHHLPCTWFYELILDRNKVPFDSVPRERTIPSRQWCHEPCILSPGAGVIRFSISRSGAWFRGPASSPCPEVMETEPGASPALVDTHVLHCRKWRRDVLSTNLVLGFPKPSRLCISKHSYILKCTGFPNTAKSLLSNYLQPLLYTEHGYT